MLMLGGMNSSALSPPTSPPSWCGERNTGSTAVAALVEEVRAMRGEMAELREQPPPE